MSLIYTFNSNRSSLCILNDQLELFIALFASHYYKCSLSIFDLRRPWHILLPPILLLRKKFLIADKRMAELSATSNNKALKDGQMKHN